MPRGSGRGVTSPEASSALISDANSSHSAATRRLPRPIQRADAETVASENHPAARTSCRAKANWPRRCSSMRSWCSSQRCGNSSVSQWVAEAMSLRFERVFYLGVVEELTIEDSNDTAVFVGRRLAAVREADDAEPSVCEANALVFEEAVVVRPPMDQAHRPCAAGCPVAVALDQIAERRRRCRTWIRRPWPVGTDGVRGSVSTPSAAGSSRSLPPSTPPHSQALWRRR